MNKIRVLHYLRHLALGGTEKTCQLFFEHASKDFDVALVHEWTGDKTRLQEFRKSRSVNGGQIFQINSYRNADGSVNPKAEPDGADLRHIIAQFRPDIFHVYRSGLPEFPTPGMHVHVPHFIETNVFGHYDSNILVSRSLFMSEWLMHNTLRRLAPISRSLMPSRFDFVNNPVERPCTDARLPIREHWGNDVIVLGRVGRPDNGIYNSVNVEAARLLRMQGHDIRFIVVAPPSNMVDDLARYDIPFYAIEPTVDPLILSTAYNSMDIYAHARADGETFGVNIAEAMMHGLPVVTHYARPSFPGMGVFQAQAELVDTSETGWVVNNTPAEYAEALHLLIDDRKMRTDMAAAGKAKAEREFEVSVCMQKLETIYRKVVNEG